MSATRSRSCWPRGSHRASICRSRAGRTPEYCISRGRTGGGGRGSIRRPARRAETPPACHRDCRSTPSTGGGRRRRRAFRSYRARLPGKERGAGRYECPSKAHFVVDAANVAVPFAIVTCRAAGRQASCRVATTSRNGSRKPPSLSPALLSRARRVSPPAAMSSTRRQTSRSGSPPGVTVFERETRHGAAQFLALFDRPVANQFPRRVERLIIVEQPDPQRRERADSCPSDRRRHRAFRESS